MGSCVQMLGWQCWSLRVVHLHSHYLLSGGKWFIRTPIAFCFVVSGSTRLPFAFCLAVKHSSRPQLSSVLWFIQTPTFLFCFMVSGSSRITLFSILWWVVHPDPHYRLSGGEWFIETPIIFCLVVMEWFIQTPTAFSLVVSGSLRLPLSSVWWWWSGSMKWFIQTPIAFCLVVSGLPRLPLFCVVVNDASRLLLSFAW